MTNDDNGVPESTKASKQPTANKVRRPRLKRRKLTPLELLSDPGRITVSVGDAARIMGISRSTAARYYNETGYLCPGVPVLRMGLHGNAGRRGTRGVVSLAHLRAALGLPENLEQLKLLADDGTASAPAPQPA